ncbi:maleylpyruvate isomerase N-terminal domain-containing protein [Streptomyces diastatochromogenes]|nr:maleylpyruvate isomerase N-terminal domain-containing protein [Streptomyces diastatochromogenes]
MSDPVDVLDDLREESEELDSIVAELSEEQWRADTPAPGWTLAHQIAHLAWTDRAALLAATDAEAFAAETEKALTAPDLFVDEGAEEGETPARRPPRPLARRSRAAPGGPARGPARARFPWYGPPMSAPPWRPPG